MNSQNVTQLRPRQKKGSGQEPDAVELRTGELVPPKRLTKRQAEVWSAYIEPAKHLHQDSALKAFAFCVLAAELLSKGAKITAAQMTQLRVLGNELGIGFLASGSNPKAASSRQSNPADRYFE